jgi:hypothetical protein
MTTRSGLDTQRQVPPCTRTVSSATASAPPRAPHTFNRPGRENTTAYDTGKRPQVVGEKTNYTETQAYDEFYPETTKTMSTTRADMEAALRGMTGGSGGSKSSQQGSAAVPQSSSVDLRGTLPPPWPKARRDHTQGGFMSGNTERKENQGSREP